MKRLFFLISFSLISLTLSAQNKVELYYQLTNKAELAICEDNFKLALDYYEKAFALNPEMNHTIDLSNTVTVCGKLNKWSRAKKYLIQLREKGLSVKNTREMLERSFPDKIAFLEKLKKVEPPLDFQIEYAAVYTLLKYDQQVRRDCPGYQGPCKEVVKYVDSITYLSLMKLIEKNGWLYHIAPGKGYGYPIYGLIILHNAAWGRYWALDAMKKALHDGRLHPEIYSELTDGFKLSNKAAADKLDIPDYYSDPIYKLNGNYYVRTVESESVNKGRAAIYLEPVEEILIKIKYQMQHKEFIFSYHGLVIVEELPKEKLKVFVENMNMKPLELD